MLLIDDIARRRPVAQDGSPHMAGPRVAGVWLLAGCVSGGSALEQDTRRSVLNLPLDNEGDDLIGRWSREISRLDGVAEATLLRGGDVHVEVAGGWIGVRGDASPLRGTGGTLRDAAVSALASGEVGADDYLLVANAAQLLLEPLGVAVGRLVELAGDGADVVVAGHADGSPCGLCLARAGCLASLPEVGFVDLKEQGLPILAAGHDVRVLRLARPAAMRVKTAEEYMAAVATVARGGLETRPARERWQRLFGLVERGASVAPGATVHNAVVLAGGRVDDGAVAAGCVVPPGVRLRRGQRSAGVLAR